MKLKYLLPVSFVSGSHHVNVSLTTKCSLASSLRLMALGSWAWQSFTYSGKRLNDTWWELNCMTELTVNSWCTGVSILLFDSNWWSLVPPSPYLDCIQAVWRGQIGHHELLRDENGSWICRYYFFYIKVQKKKNHKSTFKSQQYMQKAFFSEL